MTTYDQAGPVDLQQVFRDNYPPGVRVTPEDSPEGERYLYQDREILMAAEDFDMTVEGRQKWKLAVREPEGGGASHDIGVLRLMAEDDSYIPEIVNDLRRMRTHEEVQPRMPTFAPVPRVFPNIVVVPQWHGPWDPVGPPKATPDPSRPLPRRRFLPLPGHGVTVGVLDTGIWQAGRPWFDSRCEALQGTTDEDRLDADNDGHLNRVDGHGTFISGLVLSHAPGAKVRIHRCESTLGYVNDWDLAQGILNLAATGVDIINISASGRTHNGTGMYCTALAIDRVLHDNPSVAVIASSGNDGLPVPTYPAAMKSVIGVGAITSYDGPAVRAEFSCFGDWVDACAPGVDLNAIHVQWDADGFAGWATWSGTSFSAPIVAAAVAASLSPGGWLQYLPFLRPRTARQAAYRMIYDPKRKRLEGQGAIVRPRRYA